MLTRNKTYLVIGICTGILSCLILWLSSALDAYQKELFAQNRASQLQQQELIEAIQRKGLIDLLTGILTQIESGEALDANGEVNPSIIQRIAELSFALETEEVAYFRCDSLDGLSYSLERGQLLLSLIRLDLPDSSWSQIKAKTTFAGASLPQANLAKIDLSGIQLRCADLAGANLAGTNLAGADLRGTNLVGADLAQASLFEASLNQANLSWAKLNQVNAQAVDAKGASLVSTQLYRADWTCADLRYADLRNSLWLEASLMQADMFMADLSQSNLKEGNLLGSNLRKANLSEADFTGANMIEVILGEAEIKSPDWLTNLPFWQVYGETDILNGFKVVKNPAKTPPYLLRNAD